MAKKLLTVAIFAAAVLGWMCYGGGRPVEHPAPDSAADTTLSRAEVRYMAQRKLVCVRNRSTFPLSVELRSEAGHLLDQIHASPLDYAEEWIERHKFEDSPIYAVVDPTGADKAVPPGFRTILVLPNGRNIELTVASREGGVTPFAHSGRAANCGER